MLSHKEFFNNWARTNKDPDGNYIEIYQYGDNGTYHKYLKKKQIETKSNAVKYKWITVTNGYCPKCSPLDGRIFDVYPDKETLTHVGCKCKIEPINDQEEMEIKKNHEIEIGKRDKGINLLKKEALKRSEGNCASQIAKALEISAGMKQYTIDRPDVRGKEGAKAAWARDYGPFVEKFGFNPIHTHKENHKTLKPKDLTYKKGDIMIIQPLKQRDKNGKVIYDENGEAKISERRKIGHIAMHNGKKWVSDFEQTDEEGIVWRESEKNVLAEFTIYRNPKWQEWGN